MSATILIVEDNLNNFYLIEFLLTHSGYATLHAAEGVQGLAMARQALPDLILMDIQMPEMDGFEATRQLKADPATSHIPIVGVSSYATEGSRKRALDAGMSDYIEKPIMPETFLTQINPYLP